MNFFGSYKKIKKKLLLAEVLMLVASVFIFRGLWMLLDQLTIMHTDSALWLSVIIGLIGTIFCIRYILKHSK